MENTIKNNGCKIKRIYLQALGIWFVFMILAIINGTLRNDVYGSVVDNELIAHQISTVIFIALLFIVMYIFLKQTKTEYSHKNLMYIGFLWVGMTIFFEFIFGHYIMGHSWSRLLHDYNLLEGRVWIFVLLWTTFGPYIVGKYFVRKQIDFIGVDKGEEKCSAGN